MQGRRLSDLKHRDSHMRRGEEFAGCYWRCLDNDGAPVVVTDRPTNLTGGCWMVVTPNGLDGHLVAHTVRENEDGTITVAPGDGSSNSILVSDGIGGHSWHGYIDRGVWGEC